MKIKCPYCKNEHADFLYNVFDIIRDRNTKQAKLIKELESLGYKIYGCDGCCQLFIVKE